MESRFHLLTTQLDDTSLIVDVNNYKKRSNNTQTELHVKKRELSDIQADMKIFNDLLDSFNKVMLELHVAMEDGQSLEVLSKVRH